MKAVFAIFNLLLLHFLNSAMDKEDALIVFATHIHNLEKKEATTRENEKVKQKRIQRKNRENFIFLLDELHEQGKLTSVSLWVELYPDISSDIRYSAMLGQPGQYYFIVIFIYIQLRKN